MKHQHITSLVIAASACITLQVNAQDYRYAAFELPGLGSPFQFDAPGGIDSKGNVVGGVGYGEHFAHAALWPHGGGVLDLGTLGGDYSGAASINEVGDIAGWAAFEPGRSIYIRHACLWRNGNILDLGTLGGESSYAIEMNNLGQIVGNSEFEFGNYAEIAFLWDNGNMIALPGAREGTLARYANDINNFGDAVGQGSGLDFQYNGLLWRDSEVFDLGSLSGQGSIAYSISDSSVIVGRSIAANGRVHAVRWINQQIEDIHDPIVGNMSVARGINNLGQIVGDDNGVLHPKAWVLNPGERMMFLNDLAPPKLRKPWSLGRATEINNAGQIPVTAYPPGQSADTWALLLSPVHPTIEMAAPSPGAAGAANTLTVTGATPGKRIYFLYSLHGGGTRIPGCDLQQNALQLDKPTIIGSAVANENGVATITRHVPLLARGQTVLFQAVVQNECAISQLVVWQFD